MATPITGHNPHGLFSWGVVKNEVFRRKPRTLEEMRNYIADAFVVIGNNVDLCARVCKSVRKRLECCCNMDGGLFEHVIHLKENA